jgi:hypothetical protein
MHFLMQESGLCSSHNYKVKIKVGFLVNIMVDMAWMGLNTLSYLWQDWPHISPTLHYLVTRPISLAHSTVVELVQSSGNKLECEVDIQITIVTFNCRGALY